MKKHLMLAIVLLFATPAFCVETQPPPTQQQDILFEYTPTLQPSYSFAITPVYEAGSDMYVVTQTEAQVWVVMMNATIPFAYTTVEQKINKMEHPPNYIDHIYKLNKNIDPETTFTGQLAYDTHRRIRVSCLNNII